MTTKLNINAINDSSITFDKLANDVVMDWIAEPNEKGYIDHKTHGMSGVMKLTSNGQSVEVYTPMAAVYCPTGINYTIIKDENPITVNGYGSTIVRNGNRVTLYDEEGVINEDNPVYVCHGIIQLPDAFIQDTIARTSQIPTTLPANGGHADSSYIANRLDCPDTRDEQIVPNDTSRGLWTDFKQKNVTGLSAEYSGVISYRPYAQAGDWTGGPMHNLAFDENGIHHRKSGSDGTGGAGWQEWRHIPYRDEVEKCPEHHRAEDELNIDDCQLFDPNTGEYMGNYYGTHELPDVIFDYKYIGGHFVNAPNSYGGMLTFPWQQAKGNSSPNYASQLFIPHGDEEDTAIKFRTSQSEEWNSWRKVIDNENYTEYAAKSDHKHNVTAAGNVSLSGSVDSNGILTISATFTGTQVNASTPTA